MFSSASSTFSLDRPARCIAAVSNEETDQEDRGSNASSRFVIGTCSLREENELIILGYHEESNELLCHQVRRNQGGGVLPLFSACIVRSIYVFFQDFVSTTFTQFIALQYSSSTVLLLCCVFSSCTTVSYRYESQVNPLREQRKQRRGARE